MGQIPTPQDYRSPTPSVISSRLAHYLKFHADGQVVINLRFQLAPSDFEKFIFLPAAGPTNCLTQPLWRYFLF